MLRIAIGVFLFSLTMLNAAPLPMTGVSLASAEFGSDKLPGVHGRDYTYPTTAEVDYFKSKGMNTIRLPFQWERLQRAAFEELDAAELARLDPFIGYATGQGMNVILDPHNYARYYGVVSQPSELGDFWRRLATKYKDNKRVLFGLMNEPYSMPTERWLEMANASIASIRKTGAANLILVPGNSWTGAHSWHQDFYGTPNAVAMKGIVDPMNNFLIEVHQYLDEDASGTKFTVVSPTIGVERLKGFTDWLRENKYRAFLGEIGVQGDEPGLVAMENTLRYLEENSDVWAGWAYWAAGPWWGDYALSVEPAGGADKPQMKVLERHATH
jgi:endoglucanase